MRTVLTLLLLATALPASAATPANKPDPNVRVYRCVSSSGTVALQDAPCSGGRQQVLDMQRPQDPPPRPARVQAPAAVAAPATREVRIVTVQPPQPMYECTTEDGSRYTSDSPEGNPRWVPTWGPAYVGNAIGAPGGGGIQRPPISVNPRPAISVQGGSGRGSIRGSASFGAETYQGGNYQGGYQGGYNGGGYGGTVIVPYGNVQVRDECHALPEQEVCARLADRRWELIRRYNSALQSERQDLSREQRGIEARQQRDCGGV
ncbi:DUF4124 domain-containing protein [Xanthomonas nasturtii]|uniref:DUF4124 domain-containing protein n=1 Tax=Xanthomonas nasturtii TaxID=1843581 RepID=UPI0020136984|nr:DUF4124 domain-containing protein [Xanthomonas nasturtii]MCL1499536.1 DUF4124 domain-containing protein [Xanthomonas nasturtii]MCL1503243.1 DUF4124 domain-containing protein [Xanthomonas nasturtii]MCL1523175.1 DUF4124 domain-containing protein [Xanthomonas nasturtii]MCL1526507.1 DUF4124 domain-containing protein [Xanthomonas nasturtii]MCL1534030.1 DUF4124 domain-containing protein [Xanthomonas nasturtii]